MHPHVEVKIVDVVTGGLPRAARRGVLHARVLGDEGLLADPDKTAEAIDGDGWMHTGDLATMDADGCVDIVGRIKDTVIRGGENTYPSRDRSKCWCGSRKSKRQVARGCCSIRREQGLKHGP